MALRLFMHSVNLVFTQLNGALRISGVLYLATLALSILGYFLFVQSAMTEPGMPLPSLIIVLVTSVIYMWIAVAWHRFVLLDEMPQGMLPPFYNDRILAYLGRSLLICLVVLAIAVVVSFVSAAIATMSGAPYVAMSLTTLAVIFIALVVSYRLAPMFPGAAVNRSIGLREAWAATAPANNTIVALALISAVASFLVDIPAYLVGNIPALAIFGLFWSAVTSWFKLLIGVSILTTIYGVYVEKRTIA